MGRVVIPIELRRTLDIEEKTPWDLCRGEHNLKYAPACIFVMMHDIRQYKGKTSAKRVLMN